MSRASERTLSPAAPSRRPRGVPRRPGPGSGDQSGSSRPSSHFWVSTRRAARSTSAISIAPDLHALPQRLAVAVHRRQLDVDARAQRETGGLGPGGGHAVQGPQERHREVVGHDRPGEPVGARGAGRSAGWRRRPPGPRPGRCRSSSPSGPRRAAPSRTAAAARRPARAGPSRPGPGSARRARPSSRRSASASPPPRPTPGRARTRCRSCRPGRDPPRSSPRPGPSAGPAARPGPGPGPGGCRAGAWSRRSGRPSAR